MNQQSRGREFESRVWFTIKTLSARKVTGNGILNFTSLVKNSLVSTTLRIEHAMNLYPNAFSSSTNVCLRCRVIVIAKMQGI